MSWLKCFKAVAFKASSILESALTIAIISICILIVTTVYVKVFETGNSVVFYKAKHKISELLLDANDIEFFKNQEYDFKTYRLVKEIEDFNENPFVKKVVFTIATNNKRRKFSYIINYHFETE